MSKNNLRLKPSKPVLQVYNSLKRQVAHPIQVNYRDGTLWFGEDNAFPLKLAQLIQQSPAGSSCISVLSDFMEGSGFSNNALSDIVINGRGERFGDIHNKICESYALFEGFALNIKYTVEGKISEIFSIPFENIRLCKPDALGIIRKVKTNPYYGTLNYLPTDTAEYDLYNPDPATVKAQQVAEGHKYKGQILYFALTRPMSRFYPLPYWYSCADWLKIDAKISQYHANNLEAGFFQTHVMKMVGNPNEMSEHPDDQTKNATTGNLESMRTVGQRFELQMQEFLGSESKIKAIVLWNQMKDEFPEITALPVSANTDFFVALQTLTTKNVTIAMKIPSILANMGQDNSLSDGKQMENASKVMQDRVTKTQGMLERQYAKLLANFKMPYNGEVKILNSSSFTEINNKSINALIWAALTLDEQRQWISDNTDYPIKVVSQTVAAPDPVIAKSQFLNMFFTDYPSEAKDTAKRALSFTESVKGCGTKMGKQMGQDIVDGKPLSFKDIKRIYNYLKRNRDFKDKLFSDSCEAVLFAMWGGVDMFDYCAQKIKMVNE